MKNAPFAPLIYREYIICRKALLTALISVPIFSALPILMALSLRFGNLAMLPEVIVADLRANDDLLLKLYPVIAPCMLCLSVSESAIHDAMPKWEHFRRSTPVPPARMALAKYAFYAIILAVSFLLAVAALWIFTLAMDISMLKTDFALILLLITPICILSVSAQFFITLFRSVDKGMLAMMVSMALPASLYANPNHSITAKAILGFAERNLPVFPVIMGIALVIGFVLTTLLYKRRER